MRGSDTAAEERYDSLETRGSLASSLTWSLASPSPKGTPCASRCGQLAAEAGGPPELRAQLSTRSLDSMFDSHSDDDERELDLGDSGTNY